MAAKPVSNELSADVAAMRRFNRFYTRQIGLIEPKHLQTDVSLPEARILYELAQRSGISPGDLVRQLGIDPGQLSRTLGTLQRRKMVSRKISSDDGRQAEISLTAKGRATFAELNERSDEFVTDFLRALPSQARADMIDAIGRIEHALAPRPSKRAAVILRPHRAGDIGWIASRHGALYAQEYGWTIEFEAMVAEIGAQFIREFDPLRERCWIAEVNGEPAGSVMLVKQTKRIAKLRLLLVDPETRGLGVGRMLVTECIRFARESGYTSITLWTQSILTAARGIYSSAGFKLIDEQPHHSFGHDLVGETWTLDLK